jgi:O-antigen ligase
MFSIAVVGVIVLTILAAGVFSFYYNFAVQRLTTESTAEGRVIGGAATARMIIEKPVLGWGYGLHEEFDEQFRQPILGYAVNNEHTSHHTYLLIGAELGLVGLFLYMYPMFWLYARSRRAIPHLPREGFYGRSFLILMWLIILDHIAVGNFTDMIYSNMFTTGMWWLVLGLIANMIENPKPATETARRPSQRIPVYDHPGNQHIYNLD